ncbi:MAG: hypothetical protein HZB38_17790, partial [Planctomycetes bacterium]|nr:hypothetical protein [Planctomycetota bacterium]
MKAAAIRRELGVSADQAAAFRAILRELIDAGELVLGRGRTLTLPQRRGTIIGIYRPTRHGYGFVECPGRADLLVPRGKAM